MGLFVEKPETQSGRGIYEHGGKNENRGHYAGVVSNSVRTTGVIRASEC